MNDLTRGMRNFSAKVVRNMVCNYPEEGGRIWKVKRAFDYMNGVWSGTVLG